MAENGKQKMTRDDKRIPKKPRKFFGSKQLIDAKKKRKKELEEAMGRGY